MKKEYMKPEAEMMKFVETEEIMGNDGSGIDIGVWEGEVPDKWD